VAGHGAVAASPPLFASVASLAAMVSGVMQPGELCAYGASAATGRPSLVARLFSALM